MDEFEKDTDGPAKNEATEDQLLGEMVAVKLLKIRDGNVWKWKVSLLRKDTKQEMIKADEFMWSRFVVINKLWHLV